MATRADAAEACLDDATMDALVHGRLAADVLASVDAHLDRCAWCSALLAAIAGDGDGAFAALAPGATVGRFTVLEPLGRGAMGVVYAAHDPTLDRRVALKLVHPDAPAEALPQVTARMLREAQSMARLSHPNVVTLFEAGAHDGAVFLAMELVAGGTLREWLAVQPRSWREVRDALVQAGEGLVAAHDAGIVHRDFKPDNLVVGRDGRVRVTDFGLARAPHAAAVAARASAGEAPADAPESALRTAAGALLGTPAYMAPEQLDGLEATALSDQFAFAASSYEALFGARPFAGRTLGELRASIARGAAAAPATASSSRRAAVPSWLERAVRRGLAERPAERHASLRAMLDAMRADARVPRQRAWAVAGVCAVAIAAGSLALMSRARRTPCDGGAAEVRDAWSPARSARVREAFRASGSSVAGVAADAVARALDGFATRFAAAYTATCRATWVTGEQSPALLDARMRCLRRQRDEVAALASRFERADATTVAHAVDALDELPALERCAELADRAEPPPVPRDRARADVLEHALGELRADLAAGHYASAVPAAEALARDADALGYAPDAIEAHRLRERVLRRVGSLADAETEARRAVVLADGAKDSRGAAEGWLALLAIAGERGAWDRADAYGEFAGAAIARLGEPAALVAARDYLLGVARYSVGRLDESSRLLAAARAVREAAGSAGAARGELARVLTAQGNVARARGDFARALALHREALAIDRARLGDGHPELARHLHNIAGVLRRMGRMDEARGDYERALAIEQEAAGPASPAAGLTHNSLGILALETGDLATARRELTQALAVLTAAEHPDRALSLQNLGVLEAREGRQALALERFRDALALDRGRFGDDSERVARTLESMGESFAALGRAADAVEALRHAAAIAQPRAPGSDDARRVLTQANAALAVAPRAAVTRPAPLRVHAAPLRPEPTAVARIPDPARAAAPRPSGPPPRSSAATAYGAAQSWDPH